MLMMSGLLRAGVLILTMIEPRLARRRKCPPCALGSRCQVRKVARSSAVFVGC